MTALGGRRYGRECAWVPPLVASAGQFRVGLTPGSTRQRPLRPHLFLACRLKFKIGYCRAFRPGKSGPVLPALDITCYPARRRWSTASRGKGDGRARLIAPLSAVRRTHQEAVRDREVRDF